MGFRGSFLIEWWFVSQWFHSILSFVDLRLTALFTLTYVLLLSLLPDFQAIVMFVSAFFPAVVSITVLTVSKSSLFLLLAKGWNSSS